MSIQISNVGNTQFFGTWLTRFNQLTSIISSNTLTADSSANGSLTSGNSSVNGYFSALSLSTNALSGGTNQNPANLAVSTNTTFFYILNPIANITGNSTSTNINLTPNNLIIGNSTLIVGNVNFSNSVTINNSINVISLLAGNSSVNSSINSSSLLLSDINGNTTVNTTLLSFGNSSVNSSVNSLSINFGNSIINTALNSTSFVISKVVNNTIGVSFTPIKVYANVALGFLNASSFSFNGIVDGGAQTASIGSTNYANGALAGGNFVTQFARGSSNTPLFANASDILGQVKFATWGGTSFSPIAVIKALVGTGTINSTSLPSTIIFETVQGNTTTLQTAMTIDSNQNIILTNSIFVANILNVNSYANISGNLNVSGSLSLSPLANLSFGNSTVNSSINSTSLSFGNSSVNSSVNSLSINFGNSTVNSSVNSLSINFGNSTVNSSINSTIFSIGPNLSINTTSISIFGNAGIYTSNATLTFDSLIIQNPLLANSPLTVSGDFISMGNSSSSNLTITANSLSLGNTSTNTLISLPGASTLQNILINQSPGGYGEQIQGYTSAQGGYGIYLLAGDNTNGTHYSIVFADLGDEQIGSITQGATVSYNTTSDRDNKTVISNHNPDVLLGNINKIKIYTGHLKRDANNVQAIVLADEVQTTHPHTVTGNFRDCKPVRVKNPKIESSVPYTIMEQIPQQIDYSKFAIDLIGACQALTKKCAALEARIEGLEKK